MYIVMDIFRLFFNEQVRHMFDEIDYVREGKNAERFASLYGCHPCKFFLHF
jgi:predicted unusual protein kinase regulating ubiquinone biosynthesis (AarF/ABC1/UbiB family)